MIKFSIYDHKSTFQNSDLRYSSHTYLDRMFNDQNWDMDFEKAKARVQQKLKEDDSSLSIDLFHKTTTIMGS